MKKIVFIASFLGVIMIGGFAEAQNRVAPTAQQKQINQGVRHGTLTRNEARKLRLQQSKIRQMKAMAAKDGVVTPAERMRIRHAEHMASYAIYRQKHNTAVR